MTLPHRLLAPGYGLLQRSPWPSLLVSSPQVMDYCNGRHDPPSSSPRPRLKTTATVAMTLPYRLLAPGYGLLQRSPWPSLIVSWPQVMDYCNGRHGPPSLSSPRPRLRNTATMAMILLVVYINIQFRYGLSHLIRYGKPCTLVSTAFFHVVNSLYFKF